MKYYMKPPPQKKEKLIVSLELCILNLCNYTPFEKLCSVILRSSSQND